MGEKVRLISVSRVNVSFLVVSVVVDLTRLWKVDFELSSTADVGLLFCCRCCAEARRSLTLALEGGWEAMSCVAHCSNQIEVVELIEVVVVSVVLI